MACVISTGLVGWVVGCEGGTSSFSFLLLLWLMYLLSIAGEWPRRFDTKGGLIAVARRAVIATYDIESLPTFLVAGRMVVFWMRSLVQRRQAPGGDGSLCPILRSRGLAIHQIGEEILQVVRVDDLGLFGSLLGRTLWFGRRTVRLTVLEIWQISVVVKTIAYAPIYVLVNA